MKRTKSQLAAAGLPVPIETIERRIHLIRCQKVMLDSDLADLYQVPTKSLNLAVRRNADRFPEDFMFQLTKEEVSSLRFQFETSNKGRGGRRYLPYAFTEHGVAMLSSVLNSKRAVQVNILIIPPPTNPIRLAKGTVPDTVCPSLEAHETAYDERYVWD